MGHLSDVDGSYMAVRHINLACSYLVSNKAERLIFNDLKFFFFVDMGPNVSENC